jgi:aspartate/methionine/tyrosine aminotransferase
MLHEDRFSWIRPKAGSIAFPIWTGKGTVEAFCQEVLDRQNVMIVPGSIFEYPGNHFRLGLGRSNFREALGRVGQFLDGKI